MTNETVLSALESARLEPPDDERECPVCGNSGVDAQGYQCTTCEPAEPDWERLFEERDELREARWER